MHEYIEKEEANEGVRLSWNVWPSTRVEAHRMVVPIGCLFTPLKKRTADVAPVLPYDPLRCGRQQCQAIINPLCQVDFRSKLWVCCFCLQRNQFPAHYASMNEQNQPAELFQKFHTIEYQLTRKPVLAPVFVLAVDLCVDEDELVALRESIAGSLSSLPQHALVALITYGKNVQAHVLAPEGMLKQFVFPGNKEQTAKSVQEYLGVGLKSAGGQPGQMMVQPNRFVQPISECEVLLTEIVNNLRRDPWPTSSKHRPLRATGAALAIAVSLLEACYPNCGGRILTFMRGPCTYGPGMVVDDDLKNPIRSHHDLEKENAKFMKKASKYYEEVAKRAANNGHAVDLYACSLDQSGLHEMKYLCNLTGGHMVLGDSFNSSLFKQTYQRVFQQDEKNDLEMALNATIEVKTSRELKLSGCVGPCVSANMKGPNVSDTEMGVSGTCGWRVASLTPNTTLAFLCEVANTGSEIPQGGRGHMQFITHYQHSSGQQRCRVTTLARPWADSTTSGQASLAAGFDQEAAAVLMARLAVCKAATGEQGGGEVLRWLDRLLIRLCQKFGEFVPNDPVSYRFQENFTLYPQFMFHLRRSQFLQVFNNSPDETSFYRCVLNRESTLDCLTMIQPVLYSYSFQGCEPVMLDTASIQPDRILLLDTFFLLLIFKGETMSAWQKAGYQEQEEYKSFKDLLQAPIEDASDLLVTRFPVPRYVETEQGGSQARFLLSKVNPSQTHNNALYGSDGGSQVLTDDVSMQVFMEHLKKLAVAQQA